MVKVRAFGLPDGLTLRVQGVLGGMEEVLLGAYVPGLTEMADGSEADVVLWVEEAPKVSLKVDGNEVFLAGPYRGIFPTDAYHLLGAMVRKALLARGLYTVHAACVGNVLLVGHTGVGKTVVTLALNREGWPIYSGNSCVVDLRNGALKVLAGTPTITAKTESMVRSGVDGLTAYGERSAAILAEDAYAVTAPEIHAIALVRLNDGAEECVRLGMASALHTMFPFMLNTVNADIVVGAGEGVFDGYVGGAVKEELAAELAHVASVLPVYKVMGSLDYVVERMKGMEVLV